MSLVSQIRDAFTGWLKEDEPAPYEGANEFRFSGGSFPPIYIGCHRDEEIGQTIVYNRDAKTAELRAKLTYADHMQALRDFDERLFRESHLRGRPVERKRRR